MPRRRRAANLFAATLEAQAATVTTLGLRVPGLMAGTSSAAERTRMVSEKVEAVVESSQAMAQAAAKLMLRPRTGVPGPAAAFAGWLTLAEAASRPYHKRVKANAARLSKARGKRSG